MGQAPPLISQAKGQSWKTRMDLVFFPRQSGRGRRGRPAFLLQKQSEANPIAETGAVSLFLFFLRLIGVKKEG